MPQRTYYRKATEQVVSGRKSSKNKKFRVFKFFLNTVLIFGVTAFLTVALILFYFLKDLPDPQNLLSMRKVTESTKIYDRTGEVLLYDIYGEERRTVVPLSKINDWVKKTTIAAEDADFYNHRGFDLRGIARAIVRNVFNFKSQSLQGGSTITQQLVKNSFLTSEKTMSRKIRELLLALAIERKYSKDEILELYLNQIPYGNNAYGIEAAANVYFNKQASDLSLAQAAYLAALIQAPSYYSPYGNHIEDLENRKNYILERMKKLGFIDEDELEKAREEKVDFVSSTGKILAPHFVMFVREELNKKYGEKYIETAGLKIITTLDFKLQRLAEEIIKKGALENEKNYNAKNAALVAVDPKTGQILAMVGSRDYWEAPKPVGCIPGKSCQFEPYTNVALRERQPGSAFKPFAYAVAFNKGFTPDTVLFDLKTEFNPDCDHTGNPKKVWVRPEDCYHPSNYDDKFRGPVTMRQALAQSLNIPSVKTLYLAGIDDTISFSQQLGITTLSERNRYGLSLVLGGGEVKLVDMVAAYSVFANDGIKNPSTFILKIKDSKGNILEEYSQKPVRVMDAEIARLINDILSDDNSRSPVFQRNSPLYFNDRQVAAKTGTTQYYRDAWVLGYTPTLAAGVWVGNNDNTPMARGGAGIMAAGPIWHQFMAEALAGTDSGNFKNPQPVLPAPKGVLNGQYIHENKVKVNKLTGLLAGPETPLEQIEEMIFPEIHSILYWVSKDNPRGPQPKNPEDDPQFSNWETAVLNWVKLLPNSAIYNQQIPPVLDPRNLPKITIVSPQNETRITVPSFNLETVIEAPLGVKQVNFYLDGEYQGYKTEEPYSMEIFLKKELGSQYLLRAEIIDSQNNKDYSEITIFR